VQDASNRPVLQLVELHRTFRQGDREVFVLRGACGDLYPGEAVALVAVGHEGVQRPRLVRIEAGAKCVDACTRERGGIGLAHRSGQREALPREREIDRAIAPGQRALRR